MTKTCKFETMSCASLGTRSWKDCCLILWWSKNKRIIADRGNEMSESEDIDDEHGFK